VLLNKIILCYWETNEIIILFTYAIPLVIIFLVIRFIYFNGKKKARIEELEKRTKELEKRINEAAQIVDLFFNSILDLRMS